MFVWGLAVLAVVSVLAWLGWPLVSGLRPKPGAEVVKATPIPFAEPAGVALRGGKVLVGDWQRQTLLEVAEDGAVTSVERVPNPNLTGLAFSDTALWTSDAGDGAVYEHSLEPGHAVLRAFKNKEHAPSALAWSPPDRLWAADLRTRQVYEYAVGEKLSLARQVSLAGVQPAGLMASGDGLYILDARSRKLLRYRLTPQPEIEASLDLGAWLAPGCGPAGFALDDKTLVVATSEPPAVHRFDLAKLKWTAETTAPQADGGVSGGMKQ
ncbi:MAG: hypothetical protein WC943_03795 [Elusimicrobiota bacterium]